MSFDITKRNVFNRRIFVLYLFKGLLIFIILGRLVFLQIFSAKKYKTIARLNGIKILFKSPRRGTIVDKNGVLLASVKVSKAIIFTGNINSEEGVNIVRNVYKIIYKDNEKKIESSLKKVIRFARNNPYSEILVYKNLDSKEFQDVAFYLPSLSNIQMRDIYIRVYKFGYIFGHLIGYVKSASKNMIESTTSHILKKLYTSVSYSIGSFGVELAENQWLSGEYGLDGANVNRFGKVMSVDNIKNPIDGNNIHLSVEVGLQQKIAQEIGDKAGGVVVIDIHTGGILALYSSPSFDPNIFLLNDTFEEVDKIMKDPEKPFFNRCLAGLYAPGSTFKPCSAITAVRSGWNPNQKIMCTGSAYFGKREYHCWKKGGHGHVDLNTAIAQSCNIYFYTIGTKIDIDELYYDANQLGFDQAYNLGIGNSYKGCIPNRKWKREKLKEAWFPGDTINSTVGQGYNQVSVLQLAIYAARIASGKKVTPSIWKKFDKVNSIETYPHNESLTGTERFQNINIDDHFLQIARNGMYECVNENGSLRKYGEKYQDVQICAKTGTAQVVSMRIDADAMHGNKFASNGLFCGYAPYDNPKYAVGIIIEKGIWGAVSAAPVGMEVLAHAVRNKV
ncbi:penicillin-binding protein 2 [Candidatus Deianiraea vastatrix]|uniref:Penicillin-binding protein 2 n=1 Tax=Candidatus Deianiraea vastatrix TaxID=2163644 RepID=A0A5B8XEV8_9RICK|nr:penicillin-binding protein 2 [Candidatus Deianiraea vastatrix]QED23506.1 Penicillin-binding protein 2 [Candidatus Deianiraea vastatrix]